MTWWRSRARREDELREEIDSHLKMAALEHIEKGDSPAAAQQRARREFGNRSLIQEATREVWGGIWLEQFARDLKHALRVFVANPGFTITAVAALALGIGANTAVFSVVNAVLFKPLPYRNPDRMVQFGYTFPGGSFNRGSEPAFNVWRQQSDVFEDVSAYMDAIVNLTGVADPEQIRSAQVSVDFFRLFGARIAQGRTFSGDKDHPGGGHLVVLSDGFWKRRFGGDARALGRSISLKGTSYEIIGVTTPDSVTEVEPPPDLLSRSRSMPIAMRKIAISLRRVVWPGHYCRYGQSSPAAYDRGVPPQVSGHACSWP